LAWVATHPTLTVAGSVTVTLGEQTYWLKVQPDVSV
jgi:hypothetical protein